MIVQFGKRHDIFQRFETNECQDVLRKVARSSTKSLYSDSGNVSNYVSLPRKNELQRRKLNSWLNDHISFIFNCIKLYFQFLLQYYCNQIFIMIKLIVKNYTSPVQYFLIKMLLIFNLIVYICCCRSIFCIPILF